jgi:aryl-alcohol dehydrogenase-like predicted oxidoreductase
MRRRRLGSSSLEISVIGIGSWVFGGTKWSWGWGPQDDAESVATIMRAVELGINWIDTAPSYGFGHSDEIVARALQALPMADRPLIFTKCGWITDPSRPDAAPLRTGDPGLLRAGVDGSLRRLGLDQIDVLQMHHPANDGSTVEDYWSVLIELKQAGKVREIGTSNHSVEQLQRATRLAPVTSEQLPFSMIRRTAASEVIPWCHENNTGVIAYSPLQSGLLSGRFSHETVASLPPDDWRHRDPDFHGGRLQANMALTEALAPVAARHSTAVSSVALAWTLAFEGVTTVLAGARRPEQIDEWADAADLVLNVADVEEIARAIECSAAGDGPARPPGGPWLPRLASRSALAARI